MLALTVLLNAFAADVVAIADNLDAPTDAALSPDGTVAWFVTDGESGSALYRVDEGGSPEHVADFDHARGVVVSADGETVYVGDAAGGIYAVDAAGGEPALVKGTGDLGIYHLDRPHHLLFVGEQADGTRAVYSLPGSSGRPRVVASGLPGTISGAFALRSNDHVVATVDEEGDGSLYRVNSHGTTELVSGVTLGEPTGMALAADGETLMVSSLSAAGTAQVLLLDVDTGAYSVFDEVIGENTGAGGLHQADDADLWIWVDSTSGGQGTIYRISFY